MPKNGCKVKNNHCDIQIFWQIEVDLLSMIQLQRVVSIAVTGTIVATLGRM